MPEVPVAGSVEVFSVGSGMKLVATGGVEVADSVVASSTDIPSSRGTVSSTILSLLGALFEAIG